MSDYNLYGLNPRTFQHLMQAIASKVLAPGVIVYGDGKDGARDASFKGKLEYPSSADPWDGYLVVQAKYRAVSFDDPAKAGQWFKTQIEADLKKFTDAESGVKCPEY